MSRHIQRSGLKYFGGISRPEDRKQNVRACAGGELGGSANMSVFAGEDVTVLVAGNDQTSLHGYGYRSGDSRPAPMGGARKRMLDLFVAILALFLSLPIMLIAMAMIKATMGGPVFFKHRRVGFDGKPFYCYKFRTMVTNGNEVLEAYLRDNPEARKEWEETRKLRRDPRITFVGLMLRKSSIDELPQLFNVLKGEMSCVGPRPIVTEELERYGSAAAVYLAMRPGMTGLWQTSGRSCVDYARRVAFDVSYWQNWSLVQDLYILAKTVVVIANFREAA